MKNPTIKELLEMLSEGEISKDEFFLFLEKVKKEKGRPEMDQAFLDLFDKASEAVKTKTTNEKPIDNSD